MKLNICLGLVFRNHNKNSAMEKMPLLLRGIKVLLKKHDFYTTYAKKWKHKKCIPSHFRNIETHASNPGITSSM